MIGLKAIRLLTFLLPFATALVNYKPAHFRPQSVTKHENTTGCIEPNATACNATMARLGDVDSCVVHDTDIILSYDFGRAIFDFAMRGVIRAAQREVALKLHRSGDRVLRDNEIPWVKSSEGLTITATTPNRGPRILTWEVLQIALKGLMQCGYDDHKYSEMMASVWDMSGLFYGDVQLSNGQPHAVQ